MDCSPWGCKESGTNEQLTHTQIVSWASLIAQLVKNLPARQERLVRSLGQEDPLEDGRETHSIILAWRIPMDRGAWRAMVHGATKSRKWLKQLSTVQLVLI